MPLHERFREIPTGNWNDQKPKVPGFTAASNKYFATKQRLAYHPEKSKFGSWIIDAPASTQTQTAPPPPPPAPEPQVQQASSGEGNAKKQSLEEYEKDYLVRLEKQKADAAAAAAAKAAAAAAPKSTRGTLPKGF